ncbi:MAG TPA: class I SAM-dependent methyltransferase [Candidatus Dormibacteraeota bacterium]|nr:class I SAM-dependent methyltransferase [Candidatus Dormibacteraeota bacterium]
MDHDGKPGSRKTHYDSNYGNFQTALYEEIRREAFGEDIGQNSWLTAGEQDKFLRWLNLASGMVLLDVACGAGGPALRVAALTGCSVVGVDTHESAIATANRLASERGLAGRAEFRVADAAQRLPFADESFDAVTCIDAINHLPDRERVMSEWTRVLKRDGRVLFTDPIVMTGPLTNEEVAIRSSAGFYLFVPAGYAESVMSKCGLRVLASENVTRNMAEVAGRRRAARAAREAALRDVEGDAGYEGQQTYLGVASLVAEEGRLSRFVFVAEKAG